MLLGTEKIEKDLLNGLKKNNILFNRKVLSDISISDKKAFEQVIQIVKSD